MIIVIFTIVFSLTAEEAMINGHTPGKFTMDMDAALRDAKRTGKQVFLDFTGSDWCGWCQLMQRQVFSKPEWKNWAKDNLVLVTLDFPQDQSIVPDKYKSRNQDLQMQYGVRGYPTYIVLDSDGKTELGRLGAGRDKTAASFIQEVKNVLKFSKQSLEAFTSRLNGQLLREYKNGLQELSRLRSRVSQRGVQEEINNLFRQLEGIQMSYLYGLMTASEKRQYDAATETLTEQTRELNNWLDTNPQQNEENNRIYGRFVTAITDARETIDTLINKYY